MNRREFKDLINRVEGRIMSSDGLCHAFDYEEFTLKDDITEVLCDTLLSKNFFDRSVDCYFLGDYREKEVRQTSLRLFEQYFLDDGLYLAL